MEELVEELCLAKGMFSNGLQERVVDYELFCENNNLIKILSLVVQLSSSPTLERMMSTGQLKPTFICSCPIPASSKGSSPKQ